MSDLVNKRRPIVIYQDGVATGHNRLSVQKRETRGQQCSTQQVTIRWSSPDELFVMAGDSGSLVDAQGSFEESLWIEISIFVVLIL